MLSEAELGEEPEPALAPEVDLPQGIAGGVEALGEEVVVGRGGVDVGHALAVHGDLDRSAQARDGVGTLNVH